MRTDTRTLEERIADRDAKRGRNQRAGSHRGLVRNPVPMGQEAQAFTAAGAPALPHRVIRVLGATTGRDWLVRPGTRSVPEVRAAHSACKAAAARVRW